MSIFNEGEATGEKLSCFICGKKMDDENFFIIVLANVLMVVLHGGCFGKAIEERRKMIARKI